MGYFNVGSSIGAMIAPPLVVWAIVMHSWQMAFIISGVLSFAWAIAWLIFYKHPRDQKKLSDEERDYIIGGQESQHQTNNAKKNVAVANPAQPSVLGYRPAALPRRAGLGDL
ncbi:Hexuronate transporter [Klebsiella pneumoniae IS53]|nr:Hexuronate transporter [Klebsiella pneumoniae IS53]